MHTFDQLFSTTSNLKYKYRYKVKNKPENR